MKLWLKPLCALLALTMLLTCLGACSGGVRKDLKNDLDNYESFMDDYISFMKDYQADPTDTSLIEQYNELSERYSEEISQIQNWANEDLTDEERAYILEVDARVTEKLEQAGVDD